MTFTVTFGWWVLPLLVTIGAFGWAVYETGDPIGAFVARTAAMVISLAAWLVWAIVLLLLR